MSIDLEASASLRASLDDDNESEYTKRARYPKPYTVPLDFQSAGTTYEFKAFPGPTVTRIWEVMRVAVMPSDPFTTLASTILVMASIMNAAPAANATEPTAFGEMILAPGTIPNTAEWGRQQLVLRSTERIVLGFKGLASGQGLSAWLFVYDWDLDAYLCKVGSP